MGTLFEDTRRYVEEMVRDLKGEDDYLPVMILRDHRGRVICVGMMMPEEADGKDRIADTMAALCTLHRATEAAFSSAAWMVTADDGKLPDKPPSECDERVEIVMLTSVNSDGKTSTHTATMIRENDMAGVGVWEEMPPNAVAKGRFIEALEVGISMGKTIPPVLAELLDEALAEGDEGRIIDTMAKTFAKCRETAGALHFATPTSGRIDVDADWPKGDDK